MPYFCAAAMTLSKSGSTGGGRFEGSSIFSQASSRYFSMTPPGDCTISIRACASPTFLNACGVPRGAKKDSPGPHVRSRSPSRQSYVPSKTKNASSSRWSMCGGTPPWGTFQTSHIEKASSLSAPTTLKKKRSPLAPKRRSLPGLDVFGL
jgi:hypothetical protein